MNALNQYKDPLEESIDDDIPYDQESVFRTAEFNPFGAVSSAIGGLLGGGGGTRQPVRTVRDQRTHTLPGVRDARLETPRGNATIRLPEEVVPKRVFDETTEALHQSVTGVTARINTIEQKDLPEMKKDLGALIANTRQAIADEKKARIRAAFRQAKAIRSMQTTSMMMSLLFQRQLQNQLASHTHDGATVPVGSTAEPASLGTSDNSLLFLPMMMMGDSGMGYSGDREDSDGDNYRDSGGDNNNMMMMALMLTQLK
jgi:Sec-independent protein translocase protein TatA